MFFVNEYLLPDNYRAALPSPKHPNPTPEDSRQFPAAKIENICRISKGTLLSLQNLRPGSGQHHQNCSGHPQIGRKMWMILQMSKKHPQIGCILWTGAQKWNLSTKCKQIVDNTAKRIADIHKLATVCGRSAKTTICIHTQKAFVDATVTNKKGLWIRK